MTHLIVISNQKGGVSKTVTTCMLAQLLSTPNHPAAPPRDVHKVLVVDLDLQGDATAILTGERNEYENNSVYNALFEGNTASRVVKINDNLDLLPASSKLALFDEEYTKHKKKFSDPTKLLERALLPIADQYDFILIDTAPSLSYLKIQALNTRIGTYTNVLIPMQTKRLGIDSVYQFARVFKPIQQTTNPYLRILGVLPILTDSNARIDKKVLAEAEEVFPELLFKTIVRRKSVIETMVDDGFSEKYARNREALADFYELVNEVKEYVER